MVVKCPHCGVSGKIDESRIPEAGINLTCKKCNKKIFITKKKPADISNKVIYLKCPVCNTKQPEDTHCITCGVVYTKIPKPATEEGTEQQPPELRSKPGKKWKGLIKNDKKESFVCGVVGIIIGISVAFFLMYLTDRETDLTEGNSSPVAKSTSVKEDIDAQFGWGKLANEAVITAVDISRGVTTKHYGRYSHPIPAVKMSVKNIGEKDLKSFSINYKFTDIDNKVKLGVFGTASGEIEAGWTNESQVFSIQPEKYVEVIGDDYPINFRVRADIYAVTANDETVELYSTIFEPSELTFLPSVDEPN